MIDLPCTTHDERMTALDYFIDKSAAISAHHAKLCMQITLLLTEAVLTIAADKVRAYRLCEQALDLEYKLRGHCDPSAHVSEVLFGDWQPEGSDES